MRKMHPQLAARWLSLGSVSTVIAAAAPGDQIARVSRYKPTNGAPPAHGPWPLQWACCDSAVQFDSTATRRHQQPQRVEEPSLTRRRCLPQHRVCGN
jgi:hypothetical protein